MYSRSAKGGEKGDPNRNPWLAKMGLLYLFYYLNLQFLYNVIITKIKVFLAQA